MATIDLTPDNFESTVNSHGLVLVDFWAGWCGPYRAFAPVYDKAVERHPDAVFGKVDSEAQPELAAAFPAGFGRGPAKARSSRGGYVLTNW